ncbi:MAG: LapA family protein [Gammaproteobacteria bacterium]|nr:MAG: LapA family protein [Gammaproteobacteria bacterium]
MRSIITIILFVLMLVLGTSFTMLNNNPVTVEYYFGKIENVSLPLVLFIVLLIGVFLGIIGSLGLLYSMKKKNIRLVRDKKRAEEELKNLRTMPYRDE